MWWYHAAGLANVGYEERRALEKSTLRDTFYSYLFFMGTKVFDLTTAKKVILTHGYANHVHAPQYSSPCARAQPMETTPLLKDSLCM